jgi:small subunit ribosomal protein S13
MRHEGKSKRQKNLRELQDRSAKRRRSRDLHKHQAQTEARLGIWDFGFGIERPGAAFFQIENPKSEIRNRRPSMPRIAGVDIPADKPVRIALRYIHGVGPTNSDQILKEAGIDGQRRSKELSEDELAKIIGLIDKSYLVEGALRRNNQQNIARLRDIGSFRGNRHRRGLPVRGQRTRSNARTRKGPRKTVAGKKGVKELGK